MIHGRSLLERRGRGEKTLNKTVPHGKKAGEGLRLLPQKTACEEGKGPSGVAFALASGTGVNPGERPDRAKSTAPRTISSSGKERGGGKGKRGRVGLLP